MKFPDNSYVSFIYSMLVFLFVLIVPSQVNLTLYDNSIVDSRGNFDLGLCLRETRRKFTFALSDLETNRSINYGLNLPVVVVVESFAGPVTATLAATALSWAVEKDHQNFESRVLEAQAAEEAECHERLGVVEAPLLPGLGAILD